MTFSFPDEDAQLTEKFTEMDLFYGEQVTYLYHADANKRPIKAEATRNGQVAKLACADIQRDRVGGLHPLHPECNHEEGAAEGRRPDHQGSGDGPNQVRGESRSEAISSPHGQEPMGQVEPRMWQKILLPLQFQQGERNLLQG